MLTKEHSDRRDAEELAELRSWFESLRREQLSEAFARFFSEAE